LSSSSFLISSSHFKIKSSLREITQTKPSFFHLVAADQTFLFLG
ncbi:unnamed protein product, partial [Brassica rapa subsp. narinosa]